MLQKSKTEDIHMRKTLAIVLAILTVVSGLAAASFTASADSMEAIKKYYGDSFKQVQDSHKNDPYTGYNYAIKNSKQSGDFEYKVIKGAACVAGYYGSYTKVVIPKKFGKYKVVAIGDYAFSMMSDKNKIKSVTMPETVTTIGSHVFSGCTGITGFKGTKNVSMVGEKSLNDTKWFKSRKKGVVYFGKTAICYKGTAPAKITLKKGTVGIADFAFAEIGKTKQNRIVIPATVKKIGAAPCGFLVKETCYQKIKNYIVYGKASSAAEKYAKKCSLKFKKL